MLESLNGYSEIHLDENSIIVRNKARIIAQGYYQEEGIDYK